MLQVCEPGAVDVSLPLTDGADLPINETGYRLVTDSDVLVIEPFSRPSWAHTWGRDGKGLFAAFSVGGITQRVRWMPPGRFLMGSPESEYGRLDNELQHEVILTRGFWLAETACTQALWQAVTGKNPSPFKGDRRPVGQVSWNEVQDFIARLNRAVLGLEARLPTEAEWEYACRAGTTTPFSFGENITSEQVNYNGNYPYRGDQKGQYREKTVEVASLPANPWGLYEMHGNIWEWCQDRYGEYPEGPVADPVGPATSERRVLRGGSWIFYGPDVRSAYRNHYEPGYRNDFYGFRLALGPELWRDERAGPAGCE
ncbi:MAG: formylglycine-generating enzyme family protein [Gammaproteobacteria bacterium]|nr:formylglycine-generating enzyme family protein [Gammaproteobacteria bacterium]MCP5197823.1 formylglycine-generating enzyme family protein [Gammaproteobacteria bacterium]